MADGGDLDVWKKKKAIGQYMLVDCGEQLLKDVDDMRDELIKQVTSLGTQQTLLWNVVKNVTVLMLPVTALLGLAIISTVFLPSTIANSGCLLFITTAVGFAILNLPPLNQAVKLYLSYEPYVPTFALCKCEKTESVENVTATRKATMDDKTREATEGNAKGEATGDSTKGEASGDSVTNEAPQLPLEQVDQSEKDKEIKGVLTPSGDVLPNLGRHEYKFPVPYKRRVPFNTNSNANTEPNDTEIQAIGSVDDGQFH